VTPRRFIADHIAGIGSSGIRRMFDLGATLTDPINLSIGQPDYPVPESIKTAMIRAIQTDRNGYTVTRGIPELRQRIAEQIKAEFDWAPDLLVTSGLSGGLLLALMACINPGDEVLIGDPGFVSYRHLVRLVGGVPVPVDLYEDFQLHPERFAAAVTKRTKIVIVSSPSNPTGVVHRPEEVGALAEVARTHDLLLLSDEIYSQLCYDGPGPSAVRYAPERTILLRGFGKSHSMTGLRIGYAAGPSEIITEMAKLQQYTFVCAPHPVQYGALAAMDTDMSRQVADYRQKRNLVCDELESIFDFVRPAGGFYVFPRIPAGFSSSTSFIEQAVLRKLLLIPGEVFSRRDTHFRISYAVSSETIRAGCRILRSLAGNASG